MSTPESKVKLAVKAGLDAISAWSFAPVSNGMGVHGIPDRIACVPVIITPDMVGGVVGVFVGVECKAPGKLGTVTANQQRHLDGIAQAGGIAMLTDTTSTTTFGLDLRERLSRLEKKKAATGAADLDTEPVIEAGEHDNG